MNKQKKKQEKKLINSINGLMFIANDMGIDTDLVSDTYHTFGELYDFRLAYNACLFNFMNAFAPEVYDVHKSKRHYDGVECFGGGWFVVCATLPEGQITNHYENKYWDMFNVPEVEKAKHEWDGHTSQEALERLMKFAKKF